MRQTILHIVFWTFVGLYLFDYWIDDGTLSEAIGFTVFELLVLIFEFYVNLNFLMPRLYATGKHIFYWPILLATMSLGFVVYVVLGFNEVLLSEGIGRAIISFALNHSLFVFISFMIWHLKKFQDERSKAVKLEKEKLQLEMNLLKSQISPHFLFNTLNNIYSLAVINHENTPEMIAATSDLLRYYSDWASEKLVPLSSELEAIERYIQIQEMRNLKGDHEFLETLESSMKHAEIPPLVLLTLVENAFKHGTITSSSDGFVKIKVYSIHEKVIVQIQNSFALQDNKPGTGLKNITEQLDLVLSGNYSYEVNTGNNHYDVKLTFNG